MRALNTPGLSAETRRAATAAVALLRRHITEDLAQHQPEYALVDTLDVGGWLRDPDFDLHACLLENEAFAREWQAYRFARKVGDIEVSVRQPD